MNAGLLVCYVLLLRFQMLHRCVHQFQLLLRGTGQLLDGFPRLIRLKFCKLLPQLLCACCDLGKIKIRPWLPSFPERFLLQFMRVFRAYVDR